MDDDNDYMGDLSLFLRPEDRPLATAESVSSNAKTRKVMWQERRKLRREGELKVEDSYRLEGLNVAISSSNKGFRMLQQMGYSPGSALGKHGQGSLEPLSLDVKRSRTGLGRDEVEKMQEKVKAKVALLQKQQMRKKEEELKSGFQVRRKSSWHDRKLKRDYRRACNTLHQLEGFDMRGKVKELPGKDDVQEEAASLEEIAGASKNGFQDTAMDSEEDDSEEDINEESLKEVLARLRMEFAYCLYCGCQYETFNALLINCPGPTEDDH